MKSAVLRVLESPWPWKCAWRADDLLTMPVREPESAATAVSEKSTEELEQEVLKLRAQLARARSAADGRRAAVAG